jgi:hypothetical protein
MLKDAYHEKYYYSEKPGAADGLFLSVFISADSFVYAISTHQFSNVVELCHVELSQSVFSKDAVHDKITFLVQHYGLNQKRFDKTLVSLLNSDFSMVPEAYSHEPDVKTYLQFSTGATAIKKAPLHHLKDMSFCYGADADLINYLEKTFVNASIRHSGAVSMQLLFAQHSLAGSTLFLNIHDGAMELSAQKNKSLLFYNVFSYGNNEDILYYLLFSMEQFELDPASVKLSIACERAVTDDLIVSIKKYIRQVSFVVGEPGLVLNGNLQSLPAHYYFTLFNQHTCAL